MFIKISDDTRPVYVNSDLVRSVVLMENNAQLIFAFPNHYEDGPMADSLLVTRAAAEYFLATVEANAAFEPSAQITLSLKSRIAHALRYDYPSGLRHPDLLISFINEQPEEIQNAVNDLIRENVVRRDPVSGFFIHASHFTPSPDPSTAAAAKDSAPLESSVLKDFLNAPD